MKIAFFADTYFPMLNGVSVSVDNLAHELRALGHTVYIFAPKFDDFEETDKDVYRLSAVKILSTEFEVHMPLMMPHRILKEINPRDFDIVHAHGNGFFSFLGYQVALLKGIPYILTFHTQLTRYTHYVLNGKLITPRMAAAGLRVFGNVCTTVITPSQKMKDELVSYGVKRPITVVPNFVYPERFKTRKKGFLRSQFNIPNDAPILLSVGRLGKEKDFAFVLNAFKAVSKKDTTSHLVIVGYGDEFEALQAQAKRIGLTERIHFTGKILPEKIVEAYADADLYVFASTSEVHPMVILEAASAGLPLVVVKDSAYDGMIQSGENGFLTKRTIADFSDRILELVQNKAMRVKFGKRSEEIIQEHYLPKKLALQMVSVYEEALAKRKSRLTRFKTFNKTTVTRLYHKTKILDKIFE